MPVFMPVALGLISLVGTATPQAHRPVEIIGFGLVVGLDGTGSRSTFTRQVVSDMKLRLGLLGSERLEQYVARGMRDRPGPFRWPCDTLTESIFGNANTSAVLVTARLDSGARKGGKIDVTVSSMDDAHSLQGGQLLLTSLKGVDGQVYAVAQGQMSVPRPTAGVEKSLLNTGHVPKGALVERSVR
jgi:flagellar P-ring protein precursor FlgI